MTPAQLAQRIARMDWSMLPLQNLLAVTCAVETLNAMPAVETNVVPLLRPDPLFRNCEYVPARRVSLITLSGQPFADALCHRNERWDWIVETVCQEQRCDVDDVTGEDDQVLVKGVALYLIV